MQIARNLVVALSLMAVSMGGCASRSAAVRDDKLPTLSSGSSVENPTSHASVQPGGSSDKTSSLGGGFATSVDKNVMSTRGNTLSPYPQKNRAQGAITTEPALDTASATKLQSQLGTIHFDFDSSVLTKNAKEILQKNAVILKSNEGVKIRIEGNCDERGSDEYNLALGEQRAKAAMQYLVNLGIEPEKLSFISYGKEKPVETGHNDIAWALNRRDEFVVIGK